MFSLEKTRGLFSLLIILMISGIYAQERPVAWWTFDHVKGRTVVDNASGIQDEIEDHFNIVSGVSGQALKCDGFTTTIIRDEEIAPVISGPFSIEAWIAPQAYPWNWCAVVNQAYKHQRGYFFGLDGEGRIGFHAAIARQWRECVSDRKIPFMEWSHIVATFDPDSGIRLYINGAPAGHLKVQGDLLNDIEMDLQIGRNHERTIPSSLNRAGRIRVPASYSFDGIIDEVKIFSYALTPEEIKNNYNKLKPSEIPELKWRKLPEISVINPEFGAFYTRLKYDEDWDRLWRDDKYPDIVITFPGQKYAMAFWKGTNYNLNLVTENGKWVGDQSVETWGNMGCSEHMSDKQNRYSHVRIIENHDARVVVHWRYALTDILYEIANTDPVTNWGDWADEYYTIYPDGIAVRHFIIHYGLQDEYSITEPALFNNPGEKPEDNIMMTAVTLANLKGQVSSHSYENWPGDEDGKFKNSVSDAVLSVINLKSNVKPFYIYEPGTTIIPYGGGIREIDYRYSNFHSRNHWPVSQVPCDGRFVLAADRVTSSAITSPEPPLERNTDKKTLEGRFLMGLSEQSIDQLIPFAKFWLKTPKPEIRSEKLTYVGFSRNERAYIFRCTERGGAAEIELAGSKKRPVVNPAFVLKSWGKKRAIVRMNGKEMREGVDYRAGYKKMLDRIDLVLWFQYLSQEKIQYEIQTSDFGG